MTEKAGKAVPAMAVAGVLLAAPHATAHGKVPARSAVVAEQTYANVRAGHHGPARRPAAQPGGTLSVVTEALIIHHEPPRRYTVRPGDTLSSIAQRFYGQAADWHWLYQANGSVIHDPDMIFPGQVLTIPDHGPAVSTAPTVLTTSSALSGTLSCDGLEDLWEEAGGSSADAVMAAAIAMAESSGRQFATGPFGERGYWQINPDHGSLSTYDPLGNATAAVIISGNGTDWHPWTTFTSGAYRGRC